MENNFKPDTDPTEVVRTKTAILFNAGSASYGYIESWVGDNYYDLPPHVNNLIFIVDDVAPIQKEILDLSKYSIDNTDFFTNTDAKFVFNNFSHFTINSYTYYRRGLRNFYFVTKDNITFYYDSKRDVEFDRLHEKDYSDKLIYGQSTLTEFEKAFIGESNQIMAFGVGWKAPRILDKIDKYEGQSHYDYIGAPGGEEWPIPDTWEVTKIENVDDDGNEVNDIYVRPKQVINLNTWEVDAGVYGTIKTVNYPIDTKLSNININKGQGDMFSYTNTKPAANPFFLKKGKLEDRVYESSSGVKYYYNHTLGKYEIDIIGAIGTKGLPIFYTPEDAEKFLKRVK